MLKLASPFEFVVTVDGARVEAAAVLAAAAFTGVEERLKVEFAAPCTEPATAVPLGPSWAYWMVAVACVSVNCVTVA